MRSPAQLAIVLTAALYAIAACGGDVGKTAEGDRCAGVDTSSDPANCGACGHMCPSVSDQGNASAASLAEGVFRRTYGTNSVMKVPRGGGTVTTLASGPFAPAAIAVDRASVYWTTYGDGENSGAVMKVSLDGGTPTTLYSGPSGLYGIAVDATSVYWTDADGGRVMKVPVSGGAPTTLASGQNFPAAIAVDAAGAYWTTFEAIGSVMKVPLGGGAPTTLASGQYNPIAIAVSAASACWANYGSTDPRAVALAQFHANAMMSVPRAGGTPIVLAADQPSPYAVAVDAESIYWVRANWAHAAGAGAVMKAPLGGGIPVTLASGEFAPSAIAIDAESVYWVNSNWAHAAGAGAVMKAPLGGGPATILYSGQDSPSAIAVDADSVYWAAYGAEDARMRPGVCRSGVCQ